jgi:hypothetical protein
MEALMRFIFNFFFFGLLFYLIYLFFPEAFHTLVSWADQVFLFLKDLFSTIYERFHSDRSVEPVTNPAWFFLPLIWNGMRK